MNKPLLEITNLTKIYQEARGTVRALDGVDLTIYPGEIFGLLGVNGAGKTTLSSIIATLHPPTSGTVLFKGNSIYNDIAKYRKSIGLCPQHQNLDQFLNVKENLVFAGKYFLLEPDVIEQRVNKLLKELQLTRYKNFNVNALSGGTKQRVLIARALMHQPDIVILDEPTVGLDPDIRRNLWKQIKALKAKGITVILTTHYLDEAEELADRVCILNKGKVQLTTSLAKLKAEHGMAKLEDIFLKLTGQENNEL